MTYSSKCNSNSILQGLASMHIKIPKKFPITKISNMVMYLNWGTSCLPGQWWLLQCSSHGNFAHTAITYPLGIHLLQRSKRIKGGLRERNGGKKVPSERCKQYSNPNISHSWSLLSGQLLSILAKFFVNTVWMSLKITQELKSLKVDYYWCIIFFNYYLQGWILTLGVSGGGCFCQG
jgi:hypothetical protein